MPTISCMPQNSYEILLTPLPTHPAPTHTHAHTHTTDNFSLSLLLLVDICEPLLGDKGEL